MNIEQLREFTLSLIGVEECFPFDDTTLVFKVNGKMFLLVSLSDIPLQFNVKCEPDLAIELRLKYPCIQPGYHMNKKHWNTIIVENTLTLKQIEEFITHSYNLVAKNKNK